MSSVLLNDLKVIKSDAFRNIFMHIKLFIGKCSRFTFSIIDYFPAIDKILKNDKNYINTVRFLTDRSFRVLGHQCVLTFTSH